MKIENIEPYQPKTHLGMVTAELTRIRDRLHEAFPDAVQVSFEFDGELRMHIDVRSHDEVAAIAEKLPDLENGMFSEVRIGSAPRHPFLRRISALIAA